jgi:hypothetical protein
VDAHHDAADRQQNAKNAADEKPALATAVSHELASTNTCLNMVPPSIVVRCLAWSIERLLPRIRSQTCRSDYSDIRPSTIAAH